MVVGRLLRAFADAHVIEVVASDGTRVLTTIDLAGVGFLPVILDQSSDLPESVSNCIEANLRRSA